MKTTDFPYLKFPYETFNPVQAEFFNNYKLDVNFIVSARTSSGKTTLAEMLVAYIVKEKKQKAIYLSPLKVISEQKCLEWLNEKHGFSQLNVLVCTGDYFNIPQSKFDEADIVIMTSEALDSKSRLMTLKRGAWLKQVGCVIIDEVHLLSIAGRGDALEGGLMRFTKHNKTANLLAISGTLPNVEDLGKWFAVLNGKGYKTIVSDYRPIEIEERWSCHDGGKYYNQQVRARINNTISEVKGYPDKKIIVFVHSKNEGRKIEEELVGYRAKFLSADLTKEEKNNIVASFNLNNKDSYQILIATSVIAWGVNTSAEIVIINGFKRGMSNIHPYDVIQMAGRAGRIGYSTSGEVVYVTDKKSYPEWLNVLENLPPIISCMDLPSVATHLLAEIKYGAVATIDDAYAWYQRSYQYFHKDLFNENGLQEVFDLFVDRKILGLKDGKYYTKSLGDICVYLYYDPWTVWHWSRNFSTLFDRGLEGNATMIAWAVANCKQYADPFVAKVHKKNVDDFNVKINDILDTGTDRKCLGSVMAVSAKLMMTGQSMENFEQPYRTLNYDIDRVFTALHMIDKMHCGWKQKEKLDVIMYRLKYGVPTHCAHLCALPNIGYKRAIKLYDGGIKSIDDFKSYSEHVIKIIGSKTYGKSMKYFNKKS